MAADLKMEMAFSPAGRIVKMREEKELSQIILFSLSRNIPGHPRNLTYYCRQVENAGSETRA